MTSHALIAENVFLNISGRDILNGCTLRAEPGMITGILGRNGSGKSTLLQTIFGVRSANDITLHHMGKPVRKACAVPGLVNYLPQFPFFPPGMKITKALTRFNVPPVAILQDFPELATDTDKTFGELSGGSERLWSLLILLLADTLFTMLDEPFTHIMPLHTSRIVSLLQKVKQRKGIIVTDHLYRSVLDLSDVVYLAKDGKTLLIKDSDDLILHGYISGF